MPEATAAPGPRPSRPELTRRGFLAGTGAALGLGLAAPPAWSAVPAAPPGGTPRWRPEVHFTPARNWMNDPNGLVFHQGEYHLFFQHNPESTEHANLSWGHAISTDLARWQELDVALLPDELGEIYSGSAVVDHHDTSGFFGGGAGLVAIYTSAGDTQQQSIAHSADNGRTWTKFEGNPVIPNPGVQDFRDPKVIRHEPTGQWVLMLAAGDHIRFYGSPNLREWRLLSEFGREHGAHGGVWECPDLFELPVDGDTADTRWVLVVSINPGGPAGGSGTQYFLGDFDGTAFVAEGPAEQVRWAERSADFYAAQSWSDVPAADGRRLWVGWLSNWAYAQQVPTSPWRGAMTVPRQVGLTATDSGPALTQRPVAELDRLRTGARRWSGAVTGPGPEFAGTALDVVAEFRLDTATSFGFDVFAGEAGRTRVGYDVAAGELFVDRTASGSTPVSATFPAKHGAPLAVPDGVLRLRLIADRSCVEVYADRGQVVLTELVFPDAGSDALRLFATGGRVLVPSLEVFDLTA
ncbi:glycoside hydrolase family 32 protein [Saccharopolyspora cebuensis]|uniref:Glycoside hydrolase family 32 protein n=1 Tax=Saccharopolyspora cebuensis TaxID=418759 RepID=A0ABV4CNY5_9PSEU